MDGCGWRQLDAQLRMEEGDGDDDEEEDGNDSREARVTRKVARILTSD